MFLAYNTRAFPANRELLLDLFRTRHAIANLLGFATWADLATADQMIGSAAQHEDVPRSAGAVPRAPERSANTASSWILPKASSLGCK